MYTWKASKSCPIENIIKNWNKNMDVLLLLKKIMRF